MTNWTSRLLTQYIPRPLTRRAICNADWAVHDMHKLLWTLFGRTRSFHELRRASKGLWTMLESVSSRLPEAVWNDGGQPLWELQMILHTDSSNLKCDTRKFLSSYVNYIRLSAPTSRFNINWKDHLLTQYIVRRSNCEWRIEQVVF